MCRLVDQAKDLAVAVSSTDRETGQCEVLEHATRKLGGFQQRAPHGRGEVRSLDGNPISTNSMTRSTLRLGG